jgi:predicted SprT family Zn-dependent metalloprotease
MDLERAEYLAKNNMMKYGLTQKGWEFGFNNRKRSLGVCKYRGNAGRIELTWTWVKTANEADVLDTILHEIAHALVGRKHGHDDVWKAMCRKLGCTPSARADESVSGEIDTRGAKFFAQCGSCELKFYKFRKPKHMVGSYCPKCGPQLGKITWKPVTPDGIVVQHPRSLTEMGLGPNEIAELNKFARNTGKNWREKIIAIWNGERDQDYTKYTTLGVILGLEDKIRPYLHNINFRFHMEMI